MLNLRTNKIVTRDQIGIQPMPDVVIDKITELATRHGYTRGADPTLEFPQAREEDMNNGAIPDTMEIDGRIDRHEELANVDVATKLETPTWVEEPLDFSVEGPIVAQPIPEFIIAHPIDGKAVEPTISEQPIRRGLQWSQRMFA